MADTVLNTTVFDGARKLITHYNVVFGWKQETRLKIVEVANLASNNGKTCKNCKIKQS